MADTVRTQTHIDGARNAVIQLVNTSDGTGESAVLKVDVSALSGSPGRVALKRIVWTTAGMGVRLLWDATTDAVLLDLPANTEGDLDYEAMGGLQNPKPSGYTGDIMLTTLGHALGDSYNITLFLTKKVA